MNSKIYRIFRIIYKIVFALLAITAIVTEITTIAGRGRFVPINFFSFFTIQSNVFALVILLIGAYALAKGIKSRKLDALRGASMIYMGMTGIIFILLLSGDTSLILTAVPIDNTILHYILPAAVLLDWFLDKPAFALRKRVILYWLIYPSVYVVYTLVRGLFAHWYPYPFLDPTINGYAPISVIAGFITIGDLIGGAFIWWRCTWKRSHTVA